MRKIVLAIACLFILTCSDSRAQDHSVAREWIELNLYGIRNDFARPTVVARNLWHTSAAMYDAWAAYSLESRPYFLGESIGGFDIPFNGIQIPATSEEVETAREEAVSYAAYRVLSHRYNNLPSINEIAVLQAFDDYMDELGYDIDVVSTDYENDGPAALGNYIAEQIIAFGLQDGSFEDDGYDNQYYEPINEPMVTQFDGNPDISDPNRWQPLTLIVAIDQLGNPLPINTPDFLSPEWGNVVPFSLTDDDKTTYERDGDFYHVYCDPGSPHFIDDSTPENGLTDAYKWGNAMVVVWSALLAHDNGIMIDASPNNIGNVSEYPETNSVEDYSEFYNFFDGLDASQGHTMNPSTGMPYDEQIVPLGDYGRILAEFWADGPDSELPPGHWFTILNYVNDHPDLVKKWNGQGPTLSDLEWDIKSYFAMGGAMHDCAIAAWGVKGWYDYIRPISAIRYMGDQGQSSDELLPSYSPSGLPLIPDYIELVEAGDPLAGDANENVNKVKVMSWKGPDYLDQLNLVGNIIDGVQDSTIAGVGWILSEDWWPYQRPSFVTPPFAGYVSGHSTFSRAASEILEKMTGDAYFPGGMGVFPAPMNDFLVFEEGPSVDMELQWATYKDASDQCSLSRIFGGIHPPIDDIPGRKIGQKIGERVFDLVTYIANPTEPRILYATTSTELINDAYSGTDYTIEVVFNQDMNPMVDPVIEFSEDVSATLTLEGGEWSTPNTYVWTYSSTDMNSEALNIDLTISGGQDPDLNVQEEYIMLDALDIDTENPIALLAEFDMDINESSAGSGVDLTIQFSENMDGSMPTISFPSDDPTANSLSLQPGQPGWINEMRFDLAYLVSDADEELYEMEVLVEGLSDLVGNSIVVENLEISSFLDTKAPEVVNTEVSSFYINENSAAPDGFSIACDFNDDLNQTLVPELNFLNNGMIDNEVLNTLILSAASGFSGDSSYTFVYDVLDVDAEIGEIDISIDNVSDDLNNTASAEEAIDLFTIDTKAPELELTLNSALITDADSPGNLTITLTFDEQMITDVPQVVLDPSDSQSLVYDAGSSTWLGGSVYQDVYTISDGNEEMCMDISVDMATDLAGNALDLTSFEEALCIDNKNPSLFVTAAPYNVTAEDSGESGFKIFATFDEVMNTEVAPEITFPNEDPSLNLTLNLANSDYDASQTTYIFNFDVEDDLTPLIDIDINISNAQDANGNLMVSQDRIDYFDIELDTFLVVNELGFDKLKVFPNPVQQGESFTIELSLGQDYDFIFYDQLGREIELGYEVIDQGQISVNTSKLSTGKYFIKAWNDETEQVMRIEVLN